MTNLRLCTRRSWKNSNILTFLTLAPERADIKQYKTIYSSLPLTNVPKLFQIFDFGADNTQYTIEKVVPEQRH